MRITFNNLNAVMGVELETDNGENILEKLEIDNFSFEAGKDRKSCAKLIINCYDDEETIDDFKDWCTKNLHHDTGLECITEVNSVPNPWGQLQKGEVND